MKTTKYIVPVATGSLFLLGLLSACSSSEGKTEGSEAPQKKEVATIVVKRDTLGSSLHLPGELLAFQQVDLYAKVSGFVQELHADIGTEVTEGQLLITLEAPELTSQLIAAESRLHAQEALYAASKANYDRLQEASKVPGTVSQNDLDQAAARKNADNAQLEAAKASYKEIGVMKGYLEIRAPFNGIISARNVNPGAYVGPAGKGSEFPLFTLQEQKRLRLAVSIPEALTGHLMQGDAVSFHVKSLPGKTFTANVKRMAGALDTRLRAERVEMDVQNDNKILLPGMIAEVDIPLPSKDSAIVVAKTAVVNGDEGVFVIKVTNNKAQRVLVKKGMEANDKIAIYGALNPGDTLLKVATDEIRTGATIRK